MILRNFASKFETQYCLTLKQRQIKSLEIFFDGGLSFEIDTFLGCLWSRNNNSDVVYLDIEHPSSCLSAYLTKAILILEIAQIGLIYYFKRNNYTGDITYRYNGK